MQMRRVFITLIALSALFTVQSQAHHSFAVYDIDNKIQRTGVLTKFVFSNPHIQLILEVENDDGSKEIWKIESMNPGRWDRGGTPRDVASIGETVTILGWPARDGTDEMALSTVITERGTTVVLEEVRQRRARDDIPEVTIKRE
jgi:hypothetical protein